MFDEVRRWNGKLADKWYRWNFMLFKRSRKKWSAFENYCVKIRNQDDLMILYENHLIALILAGAKYNCSAEEGGVFIEKMNRHFCKGCVRSCCSKMTEVFVYKVFNL